MFKKYSLLVTGNNLCSLQISGPISKTSSSQPCSIAPREQQQQQQQQCRSYSMVSDGRSRPDYEQLRWPEMTSANRIPTPYQIFNQKKGSPYSKKRFYELVKYYHPDRHDYHPSTDGLSYATKLERYRLIVAANDLLSCPVKRGAYDTYGAGWNGMPDVLHPRDADSSANWGSYSGGGWGGGPKGPSQNATWEDWEKWHARNAGGPQKPTYVSNSAFVGLVVVFAALGGIGQATRAGNNGASYIEQTDALHHKISQDLMRRRRETANAFGKEERIHHFIKQRDAHGVAAFKEPSPKEEAYRKLIPRADICANESIKQLPMINQKEKIKDG